jgi:hypothetical protein
MDGKNLPNIEPGFGNGFQKAEGVGKRADSFLSGAGKEGKQESGFESLGSSHGSGLRIDPFE